MGAFTQLEVLVAARVGTEDGSCLFFEVQAEGRLARVEGEAGLVRECVFQRIRVVATVGRRWLIDPDPQQFTEAWRIWAFGARPLARLQWDPSEWFWLDSRSGPLQFFKYIVRFGRRLLLSRRSGQVATARHWMDQGLTRTFLWDFWSRLFLSR